MSDYWAQSNIAEMQDSPHSQWLHERGLRSRDGMFHRRGTDDRATGRRCVAVP